MSKLEFRVVPVSYSYKIILAAWELAKKYYGECLGFALLYTLFYAIILRLGLLGTIIASIVGPIAHLGTMIVTQRWINGQPAAFSDFFQAFNPEKIKQFAPLLAVQAVLGVLGFKSQLSGTGATLWVIPFLVWIITVGIYFALPLMHFKNMKLGPAMALSGDAVVRNLPTAIAGTVCLIVAAVLATILLLVPLFFMFMPMVVCWSYVVYASVFEGLEVDKLLPVKSPPTQP